MKENIENSESYFITTGVTVTNGDTNEVKVNMRTPNFDLLQTNSQYLSRLSTPGSPKRR